MTGRLPVSACSRFFAIRCGLGWFLVSSPEVPIEYRKAEFDGLTLSSLRSLRCGRKLERRREGICELLLR